MLCTVKQCQTISNEMVDSPDFINLKSPSHYTRGKIEVWDFIRDQQLNYHLGNAIKYICRAGFKGSKREDLQKAIHYLENELSHLQPLRDINHFRIRRFNSVQRMGSRTRRRTGLCNGI